MARGRGRGALVAKETVKSSKNEGDKQIKVVAVAAKADVTQICEATIGTTMQEGVAMVADNRASLDSTQAFSSGVKQVPVWIQLPDLELKYWSPSTLSKLMSVIGKPKRMNDMTRNKLRAGFARVLVEMEIKEHLPDKIAFVDEEGRLQEQKLVYEWQPVYSMPRLWTYAEGLQSSPETSLEAEEYRAVTRAYTRK
ncbi:OLC1v1030660C1 [Oldenlandia corymbosa var. corymbosa]|uniref:OLC1v1030660C1 n=1 Tax=Oldenlandia corymbosa var. corymbosa TaxID=529605 RepID=A0AAV1CJL3_OLDCO|nr:OLC1v1030660C1 [Oldenlandia corymbosa var. corymbosa]